MKEKMRETNPPIQKRLSVSHSSININSNNSKARHTSMNHSSGEVQYPGQRLSLASKLCTVRYIGSVEGTKGTWLGVEWDDPQAGKHAGEHQGKQYFKCICIARKEQFSYIYIQFRSLLYMQVEVTLRGRHRSFARPGQRTSP